MQVAEQIERIYEKLGRRYSLYPRAEIITNGLNPAQNLLCILDPTIYVRRFLVTLNTDGILIDLRANAPRTHRVMRVLLGDATTEVQSRTQGQFDRLEPTTLNRLAWRYDWWRATGIPDRYFPYGRHYLGIWRRPVDDMSITIIAGVIPEALAMGNLEEEPVLDATQHPLMADIAAQLLLIKEGAGEAERALQNLSELIGKESLTDTVKRLRQLQRDRVTEGQETVNAGV